MPFSRKSTSLSLGASGLLVLVGPVVIDWLEVGATEGLTGGMVSDGCSGSLLTSCDCIRYTIIMCSVVIVCHGRLAESLVESAAMLVGEPHDARTIAFLPGMGADLLLEKVKETSRSLNSEGGVLILSDIPGGTPTRVAATLAAVEGFEVVTGVNIPMLAEVFLADRSTPATELAQVAVRAGKGGIMNVGLMVHERKDK